MLVLCCKHRSESSDYDPVQAKTQQSGVRTIHGLIRSQSITLK